jgi:hypothetical protein
MGLDDVYKKLEKPKLFLVELGPQLQKLQEQVIFKVREKELGES